MLHNDKILVKQNELIVFLNKNNFINTETLIDNLISIKIDMVDNGVKIDYFFLHF